MFIFLCLALVVGGTTSPDDLDSFEAVARTISSDFAESDNIESWLDSQQVDPADWVAGIGDSWIGTGVDSNHPGPWTEVLVILSTLRKEGPLGCASLYKEILQKIPNTRFQLPDVLRFVSILKSMMRMPAAFHHAIERRWKDLGAITRADADQLANELATHIPVTEPQHLWNLYGGARIWNWVNLCIKPITELGSTPCYALSTGPVAYWVFTSPQVERYLAACESKEAEKTKPVVVDPESRKRPRTVGRDPRSHPNVRRLVLAQLVLSGQPTSSQAIIIKMREIAPSIPEYEVRIAYHEILRPTTASLRFHEIVSGFPPQALYNPNMREHIKGRILSEIPLLDSLDERLAVWIKYCVEPVGGLQCIVNKPKDEVRLSADSILDYVSDELTKFIQ